MSEVTTEIAVVSVGSNIEPESHLPRAISRLGEVGKVLSVSAVYESSPVGATNQQNYLNAAVLIEVAEPPEQLRDRLRQIETDLGRVRTDDKYAARTIDLDLVLMGSRFDPEFPLPDPDLQTRAHLGVPVAEVARGVPSFDEFLPSTELELKLQAELEPRPDVQSVIETLVAGDQAAKSG